MVWLKMVVFLNYPSTGLSKHAPSQMDTVNGTIEAWICDLAFKIMKQNIFKLKILEGGVTPVEKSFNFEGSTSSYLTKDLLSCN